MEPNEFAKAIDQERPGPRDGRPRSPAARRSPTVLEKAKVVDADGNEVDLNEVNTGEDAMSADHEGHDHEGHDHEGHDHEGHDHA